MGAGLPCAFRFRWLFLPESNFANEITGTGTGTGQGTGGKGRYAAGTGAGSGETVSIHVRSLDVDEYD